MERFPTCDQVKPFHVYTPLSFWAYSVWLSNKRLSTTPALFSPGVKESLYRICLNRIMLNRFNNNDYNQSFRLRGKFINHLIYNTNIDIIEMESKLLEVTQGHQFIFGCF